MKLEEKWRGSYLHDETGGVAAWMTQAATDGSIGWSVVYPVPPSGSLHQATTRGVAKDATDAQRDARAKLEALHREACEREGRVEWVKNYPDGSQWEARIADALVAWTSIGGGHLLIPVAGMREDVMKAVAETAIAKKLELERQAKEGK